MRFEPAHLAERFGILVIIALGEAVISVGATADHEGLSAPVLAALVLTFAVSAPGCGGCTSNSAPVPSSTRSAHARRRHSSLADAPSYGHFTRRSGRCWQRWRTLCGRPSGHRRAVFTARPAGRCGHVHADLRLHAVAHVRRTDLDQGRSGAVSCRLLRVRPVGDFSAGEPRGRRRCRGRTNALSTGSFRAADRCRSWRCPLRLRYRLGDWTRRAQP